MNFEENGNKYLFGAFLNTAYDNYNEVISHIYDVIRRITNNNPTEQKSSSQALASEEPISSEEKEKMFFVCTILIAGNATSRKIESILKRAFPFWDDFIEIHASLSAQLDKTESIFQLQKNCVEELFTALESWRNYTTHYIHPEAIASPTINLLLKSCFNQGIKEIKKRFNTKDEQLTHLYEPELFHNKETNKDEIKCYHPANYYRFANENGLLTEKGLAFFTCLFLYKRESYLLLNQLKGFKRADEERYRMTLEAFTVMRFRAPKQLLKLQQQQLDKVSLGISMINELAKCPKELYDCLENEKRRQFEVYPDTETTLYEQEAIGELIRYKDRYENLMLKALEHSSECKYMGFYLSLGKCYMKCYEKHYIDGTTDNRYIVHSLYGFGRLQNASTDHKNHLSSFGEELQTHSQLPVCHFATEDDAADSPTSVPYISESYPSYVLNNNNIGIKWLNSSEKTEYPNFNLNEGKVSCPAPDYWLSKYELPAMAFYAYLKEKHKNKLQEYPSIKELIDQSHPEATKTSSSTIKDRLEERLKRYKVDATKKLKRLAEKPDGVQSGRLADELARDILWLQPSSPKEGGKDKLTGANFQALQYALARYDFMRTELPRILTAARLTGSNNAHPFLDKINPQDYSRLTAYYAGYLTQKIVYIDKQLEKLARGKVNIQFHPTRKLIRQSQTDSVEHEKETVFLPRNIFTEKIEQALCQIQGNFKLNIEKARISGKKLNASKLILIYLELYLKDEVPEFYNAKRKYPCLCYPLTPSEKYTLKEYQDTEERSKRIDRLKCFYNFKEVAEKVYLHKELSEDENKRYRKYIEVQKVIDNEKIIRLRKVQDITLYLWTRLFIEENPEQIFFSKNEKPENSLFKLREMNNAILDNTTSRKININTPNGNVSIEDEFKIKDYGRVTALTTEKLPQSLIKFIAILNKPLNKKDRPLLSYDYIYHETNAFYRYRPEIIKMAQDIENKIINDLKINVKPQAESYYNFRRTIQKLENKSRDINIELLIKIRNAFCHNEYKELDNDQYKYLNSLFKLSSDIKQTDTLAYLLYILFETEYQKVMILK
jgi:hypothetical protein